MARKTKKQIAEERIANGMCPQCKAFLEVTVSGRYWVCPRGHGRLYPIPKCHNEQHDRDFQKRLDAALPCKE